MQPLEDRPELVERTERITAGTLAERLSSESPPLVIDVRAKLEWDEGHIAGSLNLPLQQLRERMDELPRDRALAVCCAGGYRSSVAASLLQRTGIADFTELVGGMGAWAAARLETFAG